MPLQATSGAASYDAFGGGVPVVPNYIEDVFSTYLYTGDGGTQTITNNIDVSGKGGLVWVKCRSAVASNVLTDTANGAPNSLNSDTTNALSNTPARISALNSNGFSVSSSASTNGSGSTYASWTFRKQPKFFDIVTYSGNGTNRTIAHNLGSVPGCIIIKDLTFNDGSGNGRRWNVYHQSLGNTQEIYLNMTMGAQSAGTSWNSTTPTSTEFSLGTESAVNASGSNYVAYLFAHDAGGFGLTGTDNVISCGSYGNNTTNVNLGYEPQWIMIKNTTSGIAYAGWAVFDNMRGLSMVSTSNPALLANSSTAEFGTYNGAEDYLTPTATGFKLGGGTTLVGGAGSSGTWIYIAIRRGPMKVPTVGTTIYKPSTAASGTQISTGFNPDTWIGGATDGDAGTSSQITMDRLRGPVYLATSSSNAEIATNNPFTTGPSNTFTNNVQGGARVEWLFGRAPNFHDVVCYTGTEVARNLTHNLTVAPELIIVKQRTSPTRNWIVGNTSIGWNKYIRLNLTNTTVTQADIWDNTNPTSSVFTVGTNVSTNGSGLNYVAYLFATCAGISKVGTYTGNGTTQTIDCGFTGGARFVLIKQTTGAGGSWFVYDTARGMTVLTDPYLMLNNNAPNTATLGSVTTVSTGFALNSSIFADINTSAATYLFLAIA